MTSSKKHWRTSVEHLLLSLQNPLLSLFLTPTFLIIRCIMLVSTSNEQETCAVIMQPSTLSVSSPCCKVILPLTCRVGLLSGDLSVALKGSYLSWRKSINWESNGHGGSKTSYMVIFKGHTIESVWNMRQISPFLGIIIDSNSSHLLGSFNIKIYYYPRRRRKN